MERETAERFYAEKVQRKMNRSRHSYFTVLRAPVSFGKRTFAQDCAAAMGRRTAVVSAREGEGAEIWDRFLRLLYEEEIPQEVRDAGFVLRGKSLRLISEQMHRRAREARRQGQNGAAVVIESAERLGAEELKAFVGAMCAAPVPGWRFYLLYNERENPERDEEMQNIFREWERLPGCLVVEAESLRLHAEDIYDYFLQNHIPVTIEAVVSLYRHSDGAIGEVSDVLRLQLRSESSVAKLTRREQEIASMASSGLTNREIAERLYISENTVKSAMKSIFFKLGIESRRKLIGLLYPETRMQ